MFVTAHLWVKAKPCTYIAMLWSRNIICKRHLVLTYPLSFYNEDLYKNLLDFNNTVTLSVDLKDI